MVSDVIAAAVTCQSIFTGYTPAAYNGPMAAARRPVRPSSTPEDVGPLRALAFVNTLSGRPTDSPVERLVSYDACSRWAREAGMLKAEEVERLVARARRRAAEGVADRRTRARAPRAAARHVHGARARASAPDANPGRAQRAPVRVVSARPPGAGGRQPAVGPTAATTTSSGRCGRWRARRPGCSRRHVSPACTRARPRIAAGGSSTTRRTAAGAGAT